MDPNHKSILETITNDFQTQQLAFATSKVRSVPVVSQIVTKFSSQHNQLGSLGCSRSRCGGNSSMLTYAPTAFPRKIAGKSHRQYTIDVVFELGRTLAKPETSWVR